MIANVSAHRRANAFAQALEDQSDRDEPAADAPGEHRADTGQDRLLTLAEGLSDLPKPELDPEVKVVQRAQLVAAMEAMFKEGTSPGVPEQRKGKGAHRATPLSRLRPRSRLSKGIAAGGLTVGVAAGAFGGVAAASSDALPGDSLYGLKRGMEDIKLGMADGDSDRGQIYLDQASTRLSEARRLMDRGRGGQLDHESVGEVRRALSGMRYDASEGHRLLSDAYKRDGSLVPIQALSAFTASHRQAWGALSDKLPVQLGDVRDEVSSVFAAIDEEVDPLRALLPKTPDRQGASSGPAQQDGSTPDASGTDRSTPSGSSSPEHGGSTSTRPKPSSSGSGAADDGLLGGTTGGLLDPPKDKQSTTPSDGHSGANTPGPAKPDVTLPPILPGLLPGLGIEGEDAK